MPVRRVQLMLPANPSDDMLTLAAALKVALAPKYMVRVRFEEDGKDDDLTPVDRQIGESLLTILVGEDFEH